MITNDILFIDLILFGYIIFDLFIFTGKYSIFPTLYNCINYIKKKIKK